MFRLVLFLTVLVCFVESQNLIQKQKLRFKISGRGLPDKDKLGKSDPYVEAYYTEDGNTKETKFGRSDTITDTVDPNWGTIFEFDYERTKGQRWLLKVKDHDNAREDDTIGRAWVIADDYVDRGQKYTVNLHKKGTLTLETVDPVVTPSVQPQVQPVPALIQTVVPIVPVLVASAPMQKLKFQLSARGLPDTDIIGTIDPYVKIFYTDDTTKLDQQFGRTVPVNDNENPDFKEVFEFVHIPGKRQRWHFVILDDDENRRDDAGGEGFLDVDDYVQKGEAATISLAKGQLFVKKA